MDASKLITLDELKALYPQLANITNVNDIFDGQIQPLVALNINQVLFNQLPQFYKSASTLLAMHFFVVLVPSSNDKTADDSSWNPELYSGVGGATSSLTRGSEKATFKTSEVNNRESTYNETTFGRQYLALVTVVRKQIGVDGSGALIAIVQ